MKNIPTASNTHALSPDHLLICKRKECMLRRHHNSWKRLLHAMATTARLIAGEEPGGLPDSTKVAATSLSMTTTQNTPLCPRCVCQLGARGRIGRDCFKPGRSCCQPSRAPKMPELTEHFSPGFLLWSMTVH